MKIILDDQSCAEDLYPFTLTRSAADIRIGIMTLRQKWEYLLGEKVQTMLESGKAVDKMAKLVPANLLPSEKIVKAIKQGKDYDKGIILQYPFHIFQYNSLAIAADFKLLTKNKRSKKISSTNTITGKEIFIEEGAKVEHCIINAVTGPVYIGKNAEIMEGCMVRGPFAMCEGSVLKMGTRVYGATTIGPYCMAGGEIKNSVFFGYSNKSHDGYLGDSVIGEWCNIGAGTSNSNIKNTAGEVKIWNKMKKEYIPAGVKCGLLMGDYSRAAINTSFNTGSVVGVACNVFGVGFPPTFVDSFTWGNKPYELDKALDHIQNWKKLKGQSLSTKEQNILSHIYHQKNNHA